MAASVCAAVPRIPKLPASVDPNELCRSVIVENVDPEGNNSGVLAACGVALPIPAKPAAKYCANVLDKLLDPARQLFLDKVVPVAQQLACVTSTPAAFDCIAQQVHVWLKQSIISLWQGLITVLTADTEVIGLIDGWRNGGIVSLYSDIGALGATLLLGLMLLSLIISAIRFDFRQFGSTLLGVIVWGLFWSGGAVVAVLLLKASDDAARWLAGRPDASGQTDLSRAGKEFGSWVDYITGATPTVPGGVQPLYNPGSFTALLICLLLIVAIVVTLVALVMRTIALLLLIVLLPLTLAGTAGPQMTRDWFISALRMFVALLLAKPLIVVAVRLGAVLVSVPQKGEPQATFSDAMLGVAIILLAGLLPGVIYRFSGGLMNTNAGAAPRAGGGVTSQSAQSVQSSMDMTRMIMERNAPRPALAPASSGAQDAPGRARSRSRRRRAQPPDRSGSPLSPRRWRAVRSSPAVAGWPGQAATGGGVFGDVEAPHVPTPPISRMGRLRRASAGGRAAAAARLRAGCWRQPTHITIIQTPPTKPSAPALPPSGPHLVIPGTVVPERRVPELPAAPRALPGQGGSRMSSQPVRFGPRESRGWVLGMTTPQLLLGVVAAFTTTKIFDGDTPGWSRAGWVVLAAGCLTVAFLPLRGRTIVEYLPVVANFWLQRITGHDVYRGGVFRMRRHRAVAAVRAARRPRPPAAGRLRRGRQRRRSSSP